jgi:hypothetical protein
MAHIWDMAAMGIMPAVPGQILAELGSDDSGGHLQRDGRRSAWLPATGFRGCRLDSSGAWHSDLPVRGAPFLTGAWAELKQRQPGMMLLIAMAITVAFIASWATTLGLFDLDF